MLELARRGIDAVAGAGFQHKHHRREREGRKDKWICFINSELIMSGAFAKNEPQMNADKRRFIAWDTYLNWRSMGSLRFGERGGQVSRVLEGMIFPYIINVLLSLSYFFG